MSILGLLQCHNGTPPHLQTGGATPHIPPQELKPYALNMEFTSFKISQPPTSSHEFNLNLLMPSLAFGLRGISADQTSVLFETARKVTLDHVAFHVQHLPGKHRVFQRLCPLPHSSYWNKIGELYGDMQFYHSVISLCNAVAQYLLSLPKLPPALQIPTDKQADIASFMVLSLE
eukprot:g31381.t1